MDTLMDALNEGMPEGEQFVRLHSQQGEYDNRGKLHDIHTGQYVRQQPGFEEWSEPATTMNAPEHPGEPSDNVSDYIPAPQGRNEEIHSPAAREERKCQQR